MHTHKCIYTHTHTCIHAYIHTLIYTYIGHLREVEVQLEKARAEKVRVVCALQIG
jgi:fido (protein-threonine AMPylation protein)